MKTLHPIIASFILLFAFHSMALAQSTNVSETLKVHFNETVQQVHQAENADEKRVILNQSFDKMITSLDVIESRANLNEDETAQLLSLKLGIEEKRDELNGLNGFDEIVDEDLDDFSNYSQEFMEQANRTLTIGLTSALLIVIIIILLT